MSRFLFTVFPTCLSTGICFAFMNPNQLELTPTINHNGEWNALHKYCYKCDKSDSIVLVTWTRNFTVWEVLVGENVLNGNMSRQQGMLLALKTGPLKKEVKCCALAAPRAQLLNDGGNPSGIMWEDEGGWHWQSSRGRRGCYVNILNATFVRGQHIHVFKTSLILFD